MTKMKKKYGLDKYLIEVCYNLDLSDSKLIQGHQRWLTYRQSNGKACQQDWTEQNKNLVQKLDISFSCFDLEISDI